MSQVQQRDPTAVSPGSGNAPAGVAAFAVTIFLSAFLLFAVQPLIGKYILPWFGGSPGVWTTCMLFFQVLLLAGYAYAFASTALLSPRRQALLHLALLLVAVALLPIVPSDRWKPVIGENPSLRILLLLGATLALPYFALSATGPLLQAWFSRLNPGRCPYRLYALSNVGSLLALLSYPFIVEPVLSRAAQARWWSVGLAIFALCCAACAILLWRRSSSSLPESHTDPAAASAVAPVSPIAVPAFGTWAARFLWVAFPACASVLLLAATSKICQDIAVIPFLWVIPLSLYLLSFILAFDHPRWYNRAVFGPSLMVGLWLLLLPLFMTSEPYPESAYILIYLGLLFICCMICHGELARLRPSPQRLTSYYLCIAAGGALGGILVAVVAPLLFTTYYEMSVGLFACAALLLIVLFLDPASPLHQARPNLVWVALISLLVITGYMLRYHENTIHHGRTLITRTRNFYGVLAVYRYPTGGLDNPGEALMLQHGAIQHGMQYLDAARRRQPTSYYIPSSGVGRALQHFPRQENRRIGVVGLGAGTLAVYAKPDDLLQFYEINPDVIRLARTRFTFLKDCLAKPPHGELRVIDGDARLSLEQQPPQDYDLLIVDAFSGDAIPVHLLTRECFEIYLRHLKPDGVLVVHISNRYLDLEPVLARLAEHFQLHAAAVVDDPDAVARELDDEVFSNWVLLSRDRALLDLPAVKEAASALHPDPAIRLWTDDDTNLFQIFKPRP